jgi:hypothetical protein
MKTIAEIEEDPIEFVQWAKAEIAAEHGHDIQRIAEFFQAREQESKARGVKFVDFSKPRIAAPIEETCIVREEPPAQEAERARHTPNQ